MTEDALKLKELVEVVKDLCKRNGWSVVLLIETDTTGYRRMDGETHRMCGMLTSAQIIMQDCLRANIKACEKEDNNG